MAIKIVVSDTVGFKVRGSINDANGVPQPFDFKLTCIRLDSEQITAKLKSDQDAGLSDFLADVVEDWSGVRDEKDQPVPYTAESLKQLCKIPGVANVAFRAYLNEVGAKEKN